MGSSHNYVDLGVVIKRLKNKLMAVVLCLVITAIVTLYSSHYVNSLEEDWFYRSASLDDQALDTGIAYDAIAVATDVTCARTCAAAGIQCLTYSVTPLQSSGSSVVLWECRLSKVSANVPGYLQSSASAGSLTFSRKNYTIYESFSYKCNVDVFHLTIAVHVKFQDRVRCVETLRQDCHKLRGR